MPVARVDLLIRQLDIAWALFEHHVTDLDDSLCRWEPAPGCWTVRPDGRGRWVADWAVPEPDPVPTVSIAWLTWHIGFWWTTTLGHCFGTGAPAREEITWPGSAAAAVDWLRGLHTEWRAALLPLTDADLDATDRTAGLPWGGDLTLADVAGWVVVELTKNVAEIGSVHHLYAAQQASGHA
ncbi:DinB family protein [Goodfellowiella coeruleoviolacea]|uniref:DinB superfamily protein n=1 Tax=Goodfellowiella coeruleoviolacea TaxID=334858 RepID=A0AAE3GBI6_9PSEU|nr:DinB family protein [Goodfellowiella coeruleoviolacea]MCP2164349.1 DinB superfamily protein [Goodfellowiella coeruleoviolacea]